MPEFFNFNSSLRDSFVYTIYNNNSVKLEMKEYQLLLNRTKLTFTCSPYDMSLTNIVMIMTNHVYFTLLDDNIIRKFK